MEVVSKVDMGKVDFAKINNKAKAVTLETKVNFTDFSLNNSVR